MVMPANMPVPPVVVGLLVIKGNASSRCGISMKGIDIVVHGNIGHMSAFMAQSGNMVVLGNAGEALGDSLYEARLFVRGSVKTLGTDCIEKEMRPEHFTIVEDLLRRGEADAKGQARTVPPLWLGPQALHLQHRQRVGLLRTHMTDFPRTPPRYSATFTPAVNAEIRRAAATGIYDIRGGGTKRHLPHFDDLLFLGASISRYPLEGYREKCATDVWLGTRHAKKPIHLDIPVTIAGMSFGALSGPAKEALGRGAIGSWHLHDHRRRRHDRGRARPFQDAGLSISCHPAMA